MAGADKTREQLQGELAEMSRKLAGCEASEDKLRRLMEAWRDLWAQYEAIIEAFDGFIYICSQDYEVEFMNQKFIQRTGYYPLGQKCYKVLHDLEDVCPWCVNERVFRGEKVSWEVLSPKDNRWYHIVNTPIQHPDGSQSKMAMIRDITELKQAEEDLKRERDILRRIMETSPAGILVIDRDGQMTYINARGEEILGMGKEEIARHPHDDPVWDLTDFSGRPLQESELPLYRVMSDKKTIIDMHLGVKCSDGRRVFLSVNGAPLLGEQGEIQGAVFTFQELTALPQAKRI